MSKQRPFFTERARMVAAQRRRERAALKAAVQHEPEVFVVRSDNLYGWEIRRYGGVIIGASSDRFVSPPKALAAGRSALAERHRHAAPPTDDASAGT